VNIEGEAMRPVFEIAPYKAMAGFFVRVTWPNGRFVDIDDYNFAGPAFASEQGAAEWLNRAAVRLRPQSLPRRPV
jgi:hypothetical protein